MPYLTEAEARAVVKDKLRRSFSDQECERIVHLIDEDPDLTFREVKDTGLPITLLMP